MFDEQSYKYGREEQVYKKKDMKFREWRKKRVVIKKGSKNYAKLIIVALLAEL